MFSVVFVQQGCIKLSKSDSEDNRYKIFIFHINTVLLNFLFLIGVMAARNTALLSQEYIFFFIYIF